MEVVTTALTAGITDIATQMSTTIGKIIPVGLPIIGMILVVKIGLKVFRRITG